MKCYRSKLISFVLLAAAAAAIFSKVFACGPFLPNTFLQSGDEALLVAPTASFYAELAAIPLPAPRFKGVFGTNGYFEATMDAELSDLRKSLDKRVGIAQRISICKRYKEARESLRNFIEEKHRLDLARESYSFTNNENDKSSASRPTNSVVPASSELPQEFTLYFNGLIAFHKDDPATAEQRWQELLRLPSDERRFRTVWATYMLGRNAGHTDKAIDYYKKVRVLAEQGFADSLGLAEASLGWEARARWKQGDFVRAIELYIEQLAAGDPTAAYSLEFVIPMALQEDDKVLQQLAVSSIAQRIVTAYVISRDRWEFDQWETTTIASRRWLEAVERAGIKDVASAERLALAAYQAGEMDQAERWIRRAPANCSTAQWIKSKLLLRAGKVNEAAALLARISKYFPTTEPTNSASKLEQNLYGVSGVAPGRQLMGELGTLRLSRGEYTQALDALLASGYWTDAAYVAERVLSPDELKRYVDTHWPKIIISGTNDMNGGEIDSELSPSTISRNLRYLLARRLTRISRGNEAIEYYPDDQQPAFKLLVSALQRSYDQNGPKEDRAHAFWEAARIVRTNGMELLGTEVEPDWALYGGSYDLGNVGVYRSTFSETNKVRPSADELNRLKKYEADPGLRFHYRYIAADLGWQAAQLLPNNTDETARILCEAGTWIKYLNPKAADKYYKALVRRCRRTALGEEADRIRWFPDLQNF